MFESLSPNTKAAVWWVIIANLMGIVGGVIFLPLFKNFQPLFAVVLVIIIKALISFLAIIFIVETKNKLLGESILGILVALEGASLICDFTFPLYIGLIIDLPPFLLLIFDKNSKKL